MLSVLGLVHEGLAHLSDRLGDAADAVILKVHQRLSGIIMALHFDHARHFQHRIDITLFQKAGEDCGLFALLRIGRRPEVAPFTDQRIGRCRYTTNTAIFDSVRRNGPVLRDLNSPPPAPSTVLPCGSTRMRSPFNMKCPARVRRTPASVWT